MTAFNIRIGEGWDVHQLVAGRKLMLGGVEVPHTTGLLGHSDADVLLHAITDALLGAAGLGDIGRHFPDTDAQFRGADSAVLLAEAARRVRRPVLFVHGDTHNQRVDQPFMDFLGNPIGNLVRLETFGSPFIGWIKVVVDPDDPQVFRFDPRLHATVLPR